MRVAEEKHVLCGWKDVGIKVGAGIRRERILVERKQEVFRKVLSKEELSVEKPESKLMLPRPQGYMRAPPQAACGTCKQMTPTFLPFCGRCGAQNSHYSSVKDVVVTGARAGGFSRAQAPLADVEKVISQAEPSSSFEQVLGRFAGRDAEAQELFKCKGWGGRNRGRGGSAWQDKRGGRASYKQQCQAQSSRSRGCWQPGCQACRSAAPPKKAKTADATAVEHAVDEEASLERDLELNEPGDAAAYILSHWAQPSRGRRRSRRWCASMSRNSVRRAPSTTRLAPSFRKSLL